MIPNCRVLQKLLVSFLWCKLGQVDLWKSSYRGNDTFEGRGRAWFAPRNEVKDICDFYWLYNNSSRTRFEIVVLSFQHNVQFAPSGD